MVSLFRVSSFRAVLVYLSLFLASTSLVLILLHTQINQALTLHHDKSVWRDAAMMNQSYTQGGLVNLQQTVTQQSQLSNAGVYLLADGLGRYVAGNVTAFPAPADTRSQEDGWLRVALEASSKTARARLLRFDDNVVLLIGRDLGPQKATMSELTRDFVLAVLFLAFFGLIGGGLMARRALVRVDKINKSLRPIMMGDFSARIAKGKSQDELADLETQINDMLTRIETLMGAMREVTDNLAHDLRSPLTRLRVRLEKMSVTANSPEQAEAVAQSLADIDQLLVLFSSVLTLSGIDSGTADMRKDVVPVKPLLDDLVELYSAMFEDANWTLEYLVEADAERFEVLGDAQLLAQGLVNLLENALAHGAGETRHLRIELGREDKVITISIADQGVGVPDHELGHIRQRFVRLDESRSRPGNGLGLSLVDAICRHHGGQFVLSTNRPSGLRAQIRLPENGQADG
ncbi:HAMP domain-containing histidine kinase [Alphaproteobacteria bacterium]|nr:HAMP domain-containing histidine kinase [Alphaproteobacteria bacterium]MDC0147878.1 HAMP domain-containing histidine kinase [Alphaproteobacteria bacterium]